MSPRVILYIGNFFFSLSTAITIYIVLPFLATLVPSAYAGFVVAGGGTLALLIFPRLPHLEIRFGAQNLVMGAAVLEIGALAALALFPSALTAVVMIIVAFAFQPCISYGLDLLLEVSTSESGAGRVRTTFLTAWNAGVLTAPLLLGYILDSTDVYARVFVVAGLALAPFLLLLASRRLPSAVVRAPEHMRETLVCIAGDRDLSSVTFAHFLLYLFYMWAPFYVPLYLHGVLGLPWSTLGWVFSVMLIPYVVLEYPAGWLADRYLGDKELMLTGFLLAGGALAALATLTPTTPLWAIIAILLISRVGAALVEAMTEGHFYRRVTAEDINSMSFFRVTWPLAYTVGPVIASIMLLGMSFTMFFFITGATITILGVFATLRIKDFR